MPTKNESDLIDLSLAIGGRRDADRSTISPLQNTDKPQTENIRAKTKVVAYNGLIAQM